MAVRKRCRSRGCRTSPRCVHPWWTTQRYMNARASSLAESMRQARARRVKRIDEGGDEATAQIG
jgi:hypothetical protein